MSISELLENIKTTHFYSFKLFFEFTVELKKMFNNNNCTSSSLYNIIITLKKQHVPIEVLKLV